MGIFPDSNQQLNLNQIRQQINSMNPVDAKAKVEAMLKNGQMNMEKFNQLKSQAQDIARQLGL